MEPQFIIGYAICVILFLILLLISIKQKSQIRQLKERYENFMSDKGGLDIENLMSEYKNGLDQINKYVKNDIDNRISNVERKLPTCIQYTGLVKYNAFENIGNEMSFSYAMLDQKKNGIILTGIYSREHSFVYAKEIKKGDALKELSEEESEALKKAQNKFDKLI